MSQDEPHVQSHPMRSQPRRSRLPEAGLFERLREWNDVLPWLKLGRTLRLAGSPPLLLVTCVALVLWWHGQRLLVPAIFETDGMGVSYNALRVSPIPITNTTSIGGERGAAAAAFAFQSAPSAFYWTSRDLAWWQYLVVSAWTLLVWAPVALLFARQGALLTAGRSLTGLKPGMRHALSRAPRAWLSAIVPSVCATFIGLLIILMGKLSQWTGDLAAVEAVLAILIAPVAIVCGLLVFGATFAVPLSWAAIANEQSPDSLDSLSRGYEYLLRRPLQLAAYLAISLAILWVIGVLARGVAAMSILISTTMLGFVGSSDSLIERTSLVLVWLPAVVAITLGWGLVGGVYLLLRCDAGGQEVEDIWIPRLDPSLPLPSLPKK